ncbi:MAG: LppX_LprAFG lipoprotein [Anaerolineales bacterium]
MDKLRMIIASGAVLLAACAGPTAPPPTPTPTPGELLDRAAQAMLTMNSAKFQVIRQGTPAVLDPSTGITMTEATGQYQAPDRVSASIKVNLMGNVVEIQMLWLPEGNYVSNPLTQAFEPAPAETGFDGAELFSPEGMPGMLQDALQNVVLVAEEAIEGRQAYHLQGEADGESLASVTAGGLASEIMYPVDIWLDVLESHVVRIQITEPDDNGWLVDFFDIDVPVEIQAP